MPDAPSMAVLAGRPAGGNVIVAGSPEEFGKLLQAEIRKVRELSKVATIRIE